LALGVYGFGCEDALIHLLNYVWPNIFETSPHLVQAFMDAVEGMRVSLGSTKILQYTLQVKFSEYLSLIKVSNVNNRFCFLHRVYSILHEKFAMSTGRFTILCTSEDKML
jgi:hypothetical protein